MRIVSAWKQTFQRKQHQNKINKTSLHLLTVSHYIDHDDNDTDAADAAAPDSATNDVADDTIDNSCFSSRCRWS